MFNQIKFTKIIVLIRGKVRNIQQFKEFNQEQFKEGTIYRGAITGKVMGENKRW